MYYPVWTVLRYNILKTLSGTLIHCAWCTWIAQCKTEYKTDYNIVTAHTGRLISLLSNAVHDLCIKSMKLSHKLLFHGTIWCLDKVTVSDSHVAFSTKQCYIMSFENMITAQHGTVILVIRFMTLECQAYQGINISRVCLVHLLLHKHQIFCVAWNPQWYIANYPCHTSLVIIHMTDCFECSKTFQLP